jgi:N4-gp56 family major capsid protein
VKPYVDGMYVGFVDAVVEEQLLNDPVWQTMANTEPRGLKKWEKGVVGDVHGVRVVRNNHMLAMNDADHLSGTNCYGHWTTVIGKGALACTELEPAPGRPGRRATGMKIVPRSNVDHANPLGQYSTMGWKMSVAAVVLNASAGLHIVSFAEGG